MCVYAIQHDEVSNMPVSTTTPGATSGVIGSNDDHGAMNTNGSSFDDINGAESPG